MAERARGSEGDGGGAVERREGGREGEGKRKGEKVEGRGREGRSDKGWWDQDNFLSMSTFPTHVSQ